ERKIEMNAPGGNVFHLYRDSKDPEKFGSLDTSLVGRLLPGDAFEVTDQEGGWKFRYHLGRLMDTIAPNGGKLHWTYEGTRATKITSSEKGDVLIARYTKDKNALLDRFEANGGKLWNEFGYEQFPVMAMTAGQALPVRLVPSLGHVKDSAGFDGAIRYEL